MKQDPAMQYVIQQVEAAQDAFFADSKSSPVAYIAAKARFHYMEYRRKAYDCGVDIAIKHDDNGPPPDWVSKALNDSQDAIFRAYEERQKNRRDCEGIEPSD